MTRLASASLTPKPYNQHYEGEYSKREIEWRRLGARDKVGNLVAALGDHRAGIETVLEVGCGSGAVLAEAAQRGVGSRHTGIDLADPFDHLDPQAAGGALALASYDGKSIPFPDASFDLVYASPVLEHVPDERGFLAELARVARRWVWLEVLCELHLRTTAAAIQRALDIGHINAYTPESFELTLVTAGLQPQRLELCDHDMAVHCFHSGRARGLIKAALRRPLLAASPWLATRMFTFHVGALCPAPATAQPEL